MYAGDEKRNLFIYNAKILNLNVNEINVLYCFYKAGKISRKILKDSYLSNFPSRHMVFDINSPPND